MILKNRRANRCRGIVDTALRALHRGDRSVPESKLYGVVDSPILIDEIPTVDVLSPPCIFELRLDAFAQCRDLFERFII